ncbi:MAG: esterase-like activity of phytase family protein [Hyphomicrobiales bacterium]|nr:esterase-like activity of phytase family protein [Hyphomicrobiales bacterium]
MSLRNAGLALLGLFTVSVQSAYSADVSGGQAITIDAERVGFSRLSSSETQFGKLLWRGGLALESSDPRFGGFSGLEISANGKRVIAVSDQGWWLAADLVHQGEQLTGVSNARMAPILTKSGKRSGKKSKRDAEALAAFDARKTDGPLLVGFERRERVELFDLTKAGLKARPGLIKSPKAISSGPRNGELESLLRIWEGPFASWYLAISEKNFDPAGNIRGWRWKGGQTVEFGIARHEDYRITDIAILPGGRDIVTLERSFSSGSLPGMAMRRFNLKDLKPRQPAKGVKLLEARQPFFAIDNMEGLAVHQTRDGETRLTMISDDNYNRTVQTTLLFQFAIKD